MSHNTNPIPPDQPQRQQALDPTRAILVQAPAGSGKTDLLTRRFLRLLAEVDSPSQVVAITFTLAAAAEMRHRILDELEKAALQPAEEPYPVKGTGFSPYINSPLAAGALAPDDFSLQSLARRVLDRSQALGWKLLDLPAQLRISTIDAFCRELALQQPLVSGLGGALAIADQPTELYRTATRETLRKIDESSTELSTAIELLLLWRDNNWQELEDLLVQMLAQRDRWMQEFVLSRNPDWAVLRARLERPFTHAVRNALTHLDQLFSQLPPARAQFLQLARFACSQTEGQLHRELAELADFPAAPFANSNALEEARQAYLRLTELLLTGGTAFRKAVDKRHGFPADRKREKAQFLSLIADLRSIPGLETALVAVPDLPPACYTDDDWQIVRACFTLLRRAAAELQVAFADSGTVDFIEIAQIAQRVLEAPDGLPSDAALAVADGIRHLLVDEFQDTSRRQHRLLAALVAAWPDRDRRTCFAVGDPMQSIYFFRDADAELFSRVRNLGLELPASQASDPLRFDFVPLRSNFRTAPPLVERLNQIFQQVFAEDDGSGVTFSSAQAARQTAADHPANDPLFHLHLEFLPPSGPSTLDQREAAHQTQIAQIVALVQSYQPRIHQARAQGEKLRIAVLARAKSHLIPIAQALRAAEIPFRAVELEKLADRPEVLDALALARALLNPHDRLAWLGILRAPWCGLSLQDLHQLTSADDPAVLARPISDLLADRLPLLTPQAASAVRSLLSALPRQRLPHPTASLGSWLQAAWLRLGGASCVDRTASANLDLLWSCLDRLPQGEQDLLGPALDAALDKLTALPDPAASTDHGLQLMTIHKSKGLEFEVVLVPELQAAAGRSGGQLLSWLERGLAVPDDSGEITDFLIAPLQPRGADRGKAKAWVDRVYRQRESQETRRVLYVAATRAREELHLFARPASRIETDGSLGLVDPSHSLLATAWPALEVEIRTRFDQWKFIPHEQILDSLAASADSTKPTLIRRQLAIKLN